MKSMATLALLLASPCSAQISQAPTPPPSPSPPPPGSEPVRCQDSSNGVVINGKRYWCSSMKPYCNLAAYSCTLWTACPASCNACDQCDIGGATQFTLGGVSATCPMLTQFCDDRTFGENIRAVCPQSCGCGVCLHPPPTPPSPPLPPPGLPGYSAPPLPGLPIVSCEDSDPTGCANVAASCHLCAISGACPRTCGKCDACDTQKPLYIFPSRSCAAIAREGYCKNPNFGKTIRDQCPESCGCGVCQPSPPAPPTPPVQPPSPPTPPSPPLAPRCAGEMDFVFVLDSSSSILPHVEEITDFAQSIVERLDLKVDSVQVGVVEVLSRFKPHGCGVAAMLRMRRRRLTASPPAWSPSHRLPHGQIRHHRTPHHSPDLAHLPAAVCAHSYGPLRPELR